MKIFSVCLFIAALVNVVGAERIDDSKALDGVWIPVRAELAGEPIPEQILKAITLKIRGSEYEVTVETEHQTDKGVCTLEATSIPKGMRIKGVDGPNAGKTILAIYEITGDTLRVCYDLSGKTRPADFKTVKGTQLYLVTYKRSGTGGSKPDRTKT